MHDTVRNTGAHAEGDGIDPQLLAALREGRLTLEEVLERERVRVEKEFGLTPRNGHWTRPAERPFTRAERAHTTVLFGGLTWKHERLIQANLQRMGYRAAHLPALRDTIPRRPDRRDGLRRTGPFRYTRIENGS